MIQGTLLIPSELAIASCICSNSKTGIGSDIEKSLTVPSNRRDGGVAFLKKDSS